VFEGNGFGVGLTITQLPAPAPAGPAAELVSAHREWHPTRLGELMPVDTRDDAGLGEELRRVNIADARLWAYRLEMVAELAERRRDHRDRHPISPVPPGRGGAAPAGCWPGYRSSCPTRSR
jgi:hypothetical protein